MVKMQTKVIQVKNNFENIHRVIDIYSNPECGNVIWSPYKSISLILLYILSLIALVFYFSWTNFLLFSIKTIAVLLLGHSVGMHRRLIHKSFDCPKWLEYFLVYMGALVGLGGPFTMIKTHDIRDWAQRQVKCHDYFAHRQKPLKDAIWQMHCNIKLNNPPTIKIENEVVNSRFYNFIENHQVFIHFPWVIIAYIFGGIGLVLWLVPVQIVTTITGHWLIGYFAHSDEPKDWHVKGAGVQGHNVKFAGLITMGEAYHNNHHAFPGSAKIGLYKNQFDPGWWLINLFKALNLAKNIKTPENLNERKELEWVTVTNQASYSCNGPFHCKAKQILHKLVCS